MLLFNLFFISCISILAKSSSFIDIPKLFFFIASILKVSSLALGLSISTKLV